jgi:diguanylate cyclase (GGDEF)-like protein
MSSKPRATHDQLTGLPNRVLLTNRIRDALANTGRHGGVIAVLFVDLDGLADVNEALGHDIGDQLLVVVAQRLSLVAGVGNTVARLGGDEFVVLAEDVGDVDGAVRLSERSRDALREPVRIGDDTIESTASIGVAYAIDGDLDAANLLSNADAAMWEAKDAGGDRAEIFDIPIVNRLRRRIDMESELRHAIERDQLRAHYQPIVDVSSGQIWGVEALARWDHPQHGLLIAEEFSAIAEDVGLALRIDQWMLEAACHQAVSWAEILEVPLRVSVNVSALHLVDPLLPVRVERAIESAGIAPDRLCLEIAESAVLSHPHLVRANLVELRRQGVVSILEGYRTGYTSLSHLAQMPLAAIKIARDLTSGLGTDPTDTILVASTIALARDLGLRVVAEGIDTPGQLSLLETLGCDLVQGSVLGDPLPPDQLEIHVDDTSDPDPDVDAATEDPLDPPSDPRGLPEVPRPVVERLPADGPPSPDQYPARRETRMPGAEDDRSFTWLHLSDFHVGEDLAQPLWDDAIEDLLMEDLATVLDRTGPIDVVFITGDLTQQGRESEFEEFDVRITRLVSALSSEEPPIFLAVPGNHDLSRPDKDSEFLRRMRDWSSDQALRQQFWEDAASEGRQRVTTAFRNWTKWARTGIDWHRLADVKRDGVLPGDFVATIDKGVRIGVLGLNSAALQLSGRDHQGRLSLNGIQARDLVPRLDDWVADHDACFLLTHHDETWFDQEGRYALRGEIAVPGRFDAHLCGHRHEQMRTLESPGDAEATRTIVGRSLFGMDWHGDHKTRRHGYSIGSIRFEPDGRILRLWPRWNAARPREGTPLIKVDATDSTDGWATPPEQLGLSPRLRRPHRSVGVVG